MKNIPVFTACGGTATLILKEIPTKREAYVIIHTHTPGQEIAQSRICADFCRQVGAKNVFISCGDKSVLDLPISHDMLKLTLARSQLTKPEREITLIPLTQESTPDYISRYNTAFSSVLNSATLDSADIQRSISEGSKFYFAASVDCPVGLGEIRGSELRAIVSFSPGWGTSVTQTLLAETEGDPICLFVCSANERAMYLYEKLGFSCTSLVSRWYCV